jgi:ssRNA-specific RNase YbeY (16S rRNA maturation enzyme)
MNFVSKSLISSALLFALSSTTALTAVAQINNPVTKQGASQNNYLGNAQIQQRGTVETGGVNGGGGDMLKTGIIPKNALQIVKSHIEVDYYGFLSFLLRLENIAYSESEKSSRDLHKQRRLEEMTGNNSGSPDINSLKINSALNLMFFSSPELNPVNAIKSGRIKFSYTNESCLHQNRPGDAAAVSDKNTDGTMMIGAGVICISTKRLSQLEYRELKRELYSLVIHEIGHLYGLNEAQAHALQKIVFGHFEYLGINNSSDCPFLSTRAAIYKLKTERYSLRLGIEQVKRYVAEKNQMLRLQLTSEASQISLTAIHNSKNTLLKIQNIWKTEFRDFGVVASIDHPLDYVNNKALYYFGSPETKNIWYPMRPESIDDYEKVFGVLSKAIIDLEKAYNEYLIDYEVRAYGYNPQTTLVIQQF